MSSIGQKYHDTMSVRLLASGATLAQRNQAFSVLWTLLRFKKAESYDVEISMSELAERKGIARPHLSRTLKLLETVGAITRKTKGLYRITITSDGEYSGSVAKE